MVLMVLDWDMDVDVLGAEDQPAWDCYPCLASHMTGLTLSSPTQTKLSQFYDFTNPDNIPYKLPTVSAGDGAMGRGMLCQGHLTMVRPYDVYDGYDVRCMTYDSTTVRQGHTG